MTRRGAASENIAKLIRDPHRRDVVMRRMQNLVRHASQAGLKTPLMRRSIVQLRSAAAMLAATRSVREARLAVRIARYATRALQRGAERRSSRLSGSSRIAQRKVTMSAQMRAVKVRLERVKARFNATSRLKERSIAKRSVGKRERGTGARVERLASRALRQRKISLDQSRVRTREGVSSSKRGVDKRERGTGARVERVATRALRQRKISLDQPRARTREGLSKIRGKRSSVSKKDITHSSSRDLEVRRLRRDVRELKSALHNILPMIELINAAAGKRSSRLREDELDLRGVSSLRELRAILRKKRLSTLDSQKVEKALAKKKRQGAQGGTTAATTSSTKKQGGTQETTEANAQPTDAEQKTFDKTLSTFRMRTEDSTGDESGEGDDELAGHWEHLEPLT